jgi:hypothetical protein
VERLKLSETQIRARYALLSFIGRMLTGFAGFSLKVKVGSLWGVNSDNVLRGIHHVPHLDSRHYR